MKPEDSVSKNGCDMTGLSRYCTNKGVKVVRLRSKTSGPDGPNEYLGDVVNMCAECRKSNNGGFKIVKP